MSLTDLHEVFKAVAFEVLRGEPLLEFENNILICAIEERLVLIRDLVVVDRNTKDGPATHVFTPERDSSLQSENDVEEKVLPFCYGVINLVNYVLLPSCTSEKSTIRAHWLKGDAIAQLAFLSTFGRSKNLNTWAFKSFQKCLMISESSLKKCSLHRLGSVLRMARLMQNMCGEQDRAYVLASKGLNDAIFSLWLTGEDGEYKACGARKKKLLFELKTLVDKTHRTLDLNISISNEAAQARVQNNDDTQSSEGSDSVLTESTISEYRTDSENGSLNLSPPRAFRIHSVPTPYVDNLFSSKKSDTDSENAFFHFSYPLRNTSPSDSLSGSE